MNLPPPPNSQDKLERLAQTLEGATTALQAVSESKPKPKRSFPKIGFSILESDYRLPMVSFIWETLGISVAWGLVGWFCSAKGWGVAVRPLAWLIYHFFLCPISVGAALLVALVAQVYFKQSRYGIEILCQLAVAYLFAYGACSTLFGFKF